MNPVFSGPMIDCFIIVVVVCVIIWAVTCKPKKAKEYKSYCLSADWVRQHKLRKFMKNSKINGGNV